MTIINVNQLYQYTLIQFSPDWGRGELLNIGALVWDTAGEAYALAIDPPALARAWACRVGPPYPGNTSPERAAADYETFLHQRIHALASPSTAENMMRWLNAPNLGTYSSLFIGLGVGCGFYMDAMPTVQDALADIMARQVRLPAKESVA